MKYDAIIKNAFITDYNGITVARGDIYEDSKGRFADGTFIRTSYIVNGPDENNIICTRNSVYKLEFADDVKGSN